MPAVPRFILRRLYVKGSLRNTGQGFRFSLCNKLGAGYARRLLPVSVNGTAADLECCYFHSEDARHSFAEVSKSAPFSLALNKTTVIEVEGGTLSDAPQTIGMGFEVPGLGLLKFDFTDMAANG